MFERWYSKAEVGFGLIEALVALAVTGLIGLAAISLTTSISDSLGHVDMQDQLVDLQTYIKRNVDCTKTLPDPQIAAGTRINLKGKDGADLATPVAGTGSFAGAQNLQHRWYVLSVSNGQGLTVTAAKGDGSEFALHPIFKNRRLDFANAEYNPLMGLGAATTLCARSEDNSRATTYVEVTKYQVKDWIPTLPVLPNCGYGGGDPSPMFCGILYAMTFPHYASLVCGEVCRRFDYASGEMTAVHERRWDPEMVGGVWVRYWSPVPLDQHKIGCLCYK